MAPSCAMSRTLRESPEGSIRSLKNQWGFFNACSDLKVEERLHHPLAVLGSTAHPHRHDSTQCVSSSRPSKPASSRRRSLEMEHGEGRRMAEMAQMESAGQSCHFLKSVVWGLIVNPEEFSSPPEFCKAGSFPKAAKH